MASRKHCLEDRELEPERKKNCQLGGDEVLKYNPSFLATQRTSVSCPGYTVDELRAIARRLGIAVRGLSKVELVEAIRQRPC